MSAYLHMQGRLSTSASLHVQRKSRACIVRNSCARDSLDIGTSLIICNSIDRCTSCSDGTGFNFCMRRSLQPAITPQGPTRKAALCYKQLCQARTSRIRRARGQKRTRGNETYPFQHRRDLAAICRLSSRTHKAYTRSITSLGKR